MDRAPAPPPGEDDLPDAERPRVVGVDSDEADDVISALSSGTARRVLEAVHDEPDTQSGLAERLDTTIQTVEYHLSNLQAAGLVAVGDVATTDGGREMDVYAPTEGQVVVLAGDEEDEGLRAALRRTLGGVGLLALASLVVDRLLRAGGPGPGPPPEPGPTETPAATGAPAETPTPSPVQDGGPTGTPVAEPTATPVPTEPATPAPTATPSPAAAEPGLFDATLTTLPPGLVFFLGGLVGILLVVALARWRRLS